MELLGNIGKIFDFILNKLAILAGALVILLMLLMCYESVMRYVFRLPPLWVVDLYTG